MNKSFTPVRVGRYTLPNRLVMAPMTRSRAKFDGTPGELAAEYYAQRASVGLIVVREPATRLLFQHGQFTDQDARWVALSTALYSSAIWAFYVAGAMRGSRGWQPRQIRAPVDSTA